MKLKLSLAVILLLTTSTAAPAAIVTFTGDTTGAPTFNRPLEDRTALSAVGVDVHYQDYAFTVNTDGNYSFLTTGAFDTFVFLYGPTFDPVSPLQNALAGDDDLVSFQTSGFAADLTANAVYHYIVTGFENPDFGAWTTTIGGPGNITGAITPVPLPAAAWLLISGLGVVAMRVRRRTAGSSVAA